MRNIAALAAEIGVNERTLRRAINDGALRGRRPSPGRLDLPLAERQYVRRSWKLIAALRSLLRTERNVRFALLFGSAARGTDVADSDVDVLVGLRDDQLERLLELNEKLSAASGRPVDVIRLTDAAREPLLLAHALADGRVLVDRDGHWPQLHRRASSLGRLGVRRQAERARRALDDIDRLLAV